MYALAEQLARSHQHELLAEHDNDRRSRALLRMLRAERRSERRQAAARAQAQAAADAAQHAALVAQRVHAAV